MEMKARNCSVKHAIYAPVDNPFRRILHIHFLRISDDNSFAIFEDNSVLSMWLVWTQGGKCVEF